MMIPTVKDELYTNNCKLEFQLKNKSKSSRDVLLWFAWCGWLHEQPKNNWIEFLEFDNIKQPYEWNKQ